jgi:putative Ca2+/H+ antiporter (TMEM165/GDT1 family)
VSVSLVTVAIVFVAIFPVELPDKTFIATLVLATRYRPLLVWIGVTSAFLVQTVVAVTFGGLLAQLPRTPVEVAAALLFLVGGIILLRGVSDADEEETLTEAEFASKGAAGATGIRAVATCFTVLFLAEWGDLSQLLTASLAMRYDDPLSVGLGAFLALATVAALGAALGRVLLRRIRLAWIRTTGGAVCLLLSLATALSVLGIISI